MKKLLKKLLIIIPIFTIIIITIFSFLGSSVSYDAKNENNNLTTEQKSLNNNISKKSAISFENNDYHAYLYLDFANEVYVSCDIYYSYSVNEKTGDLLSITSSVDYEYTDPYDDYTYTTTFFACFLPKINNTDFINIKDITSIQFEYSLEPNSQNNQYISPQIFCYFYYTIDNINDEINFYSIADLSSSILLNSNYHWVGNNKHNFNITDDSFILFNELYSVYFTLGRDLGIEIGRGYGYEEGYKIGFDDGEQKQKDKFEESGNIFDNIWSFLEKGVSTVLSVFSIEILPGIPLSICIIIPLVFGIIFFIWKGGAQ